MKIKDEIDLGALREFLRKIDLRLPIPLSSRVNLDEYAQKVVKSGGKIIGIIETNVLVAAILFYANDTVEKKAYITLLGTLQGYEGRGYGRKLIEKAEKYAKTVGMFSMHLDTQINNRKAIEFYSRNGYQINNIIETRVHMIKEI